MRRAVLFLFFILFEAFTWIQAQEFSFIKYGVEEGLAHTQTTALLQDRNGYLWITTVAGVSKFDGMKFTSYSIQNGLLDNRVYSIYEDKKGRIWFGSTGGLSCFDGEKFNVFPLKEEFAGRLIHSIAEDEQGRVVISIRNFGLAVLELDLTYSYYHINTRLPGQHIRQVGSRENGEIWLMSTDRLHILKDDTVIHHPHPFFEADRSYSGFYQTDSSLWVSTFHQGVFELKEDTVLHYSEKEGTCSNYIWSITCDAQGGLWASTSKGVVFIKNGIVKNFDRSHGLIYPSIKQTLLDNEGNIWLASDGGGIYRFTGDAFSNYNSARHRAANSVLGITEDQNDNIWIGSYDQGLFVKRTGEDFERIEPAVRCTAILMDSIRQSPIVGSYDGIYEVHNNRIVMKSITRLDGTTVGFGELAVFGLKRNDENSFWLGTYDGIGFVRNDSLVQYVQEIEGQSLDMVIAMEKDKRGNMWFGAFQGLFKYDGNFSQVPLRGGPTKSVNTLLCDYMETLWIGSYEGLYFYRNDSCVRLNLGDKFQDQIINFTIQDHLRQLWVGTNNGLYRLNLEKFYQGDTLLAHFTNLDGIQSLETNQNTAFEDHLGQLWFGTSVGITRYSPQETVLINKEYKPLINITDVRLFLEKMPIFGQQDTLTKALPEHLTFEYDQNHLTFDFVGISLASGKHVMYRYKLDGFDSHWSPPSSARLATYSNLLPGDYTFHVYAIDKFGATSATPATFRFSITAPFWQTLWFRVFIFLLAAAVVALIYFWRLSISRRKTATQRLLYQSKLLELEQQSLSSNMNRHFIFNALNSIQLYINQEDKKSANKYLTQFAKLVRLNLDTALDEQLTLRTELDRLKLYLSLESMRFQGQFSYAIHLDDEIDDARMVVPSMILQPFIENSIWHGILPKDGEGKVQLNIGKKEGHLLIVIEDDGIGLEASLAAQKDKKKAHVSRGVQITRDRLALYTNLTHQKASVKGPYQNPNGVGTRVEIVLPWISINRNNLAQKENS